MSEDLYRTGPSYKITGPEWWYTLIPKQELPVRRQPCLSAILLARIQLCYALTRKLFGLPGSGQGDR